MSAAVSAPAPSSGSAGVTPQRIIPRGVLLFVRHGETDWNAAGRLQGRRDTSLNPRGRRQAEIAGRTLAGLGARPHALRWLASPLSRTRLTMEIMRAAMGLDPADYVTDARLAEISFGRWEGMTWKEIRACAPQAHAARKASPWTFTPPGGESYAAVAARLAPLLAELAGDAVIVSHGGVARALLALACGLPPDEAAHAPVWQGRVLRIDACGYRWLPEGLPPGHGDAPLLAGADAAGGEAPQA